MSEPDNSLNFDDLAPTEVPVTIGKRKFILREADTAVYTRYRDGMQKEITVDPETKKISAGAATKAQIQAVAMSLTEVRVDGNARTQHIKVKVETVMALKPAVTKALFAKLCEISPGLSVESDSTAKLRESSLKNLLVDGTDSSDTAETTDATSTN